MLAGLALLVNLLTRQLVNFIFPTSYLILLTPLACLHQLHHPFNSLVNLLTRQLVNPLTKKYTSTLSAFASAMAGRDWQ
jgi:hypothetical protein